MDKYKKIQILGKGTYGTVYLCQRKKVKVVLKEINIYLNENSLKAAKTELQILKTLEHPNVIQYYKHYISPQYFCIIMEYANQGNLHDFVANQRQWGLLPQQMVLNIFCQIVLGLNYIHSKQIIHRDLKCENILLSGWKKDVVKIADFGISKLLDREYTSTVIGTPNYLAPEICNEQPYDAKCDIWALGCILYELCALERMFDGNLTNVVLSISKGQLKEINYNIYDKRIQDVINIILSKDPKHRPDTNTIISYPILLPTVLKLLIDLGQIV